ncbi:MAG: hypothetical protein E7447_07325 [Ruminococcaceae bacterium]|nr:hypothetical protein [Oscillospiraceae bacterium]
MAYQITYDIAGSAKYVTSSRRRYRRIGFILLILGLSAILLWSGGGDWAVTVGAMEEMVEQLSEGTGMKEAFSAFCLEILNGAELG